MYEIADRPYLTCTCGPSTSSSSFDLELCSLERLCRRCPRHLQHGLAECAKRYDLTFPVLPLWCHMVGAREAIEPPRHWNGKRGGHRGRKTEALWPLSLGDCSPHELCRRCPRHLEPGLAECAKRFDLTWPLLPLCNHIFRMRETIKPA